MLTQKLYIVFLGCFCTLGLTAQQLAKQVVLDYRGERLEDVLKDMEDRYALSFVYSSSFVPVDKKITYSTPGESIQTVLLEMLEGSSVEPVERRGFIVLRPAPGKTQKLGSREQKPEFTLNPQPLITEEELAQRFLEARQQLAALPLIEPRRYESLPGGNRMHLPRLNKYRSEWQRSAPFQTERQPTFRNAQISFLPMLGTNFTESDEVTNKVSVNLLWGINGGVDGIEVGGFVNTIYEDVEGVQVAGLGNTVRGNVEGTQVGGLFNVAGDAASGVQAAGLFNVSGSSSATQVAGLFNLSRGATSGVQASLLFNRAGIGEDVLQVAGAFNKSKGNAKLQASLFYNSAEDVQSGQYSLLFNKARHLKGVQFGLINIADTVAGVPIGLFNFIRKGYNRIEVGASETFWLNAGIKFGARRFYNILHLGMRWDDVSPEQPVESAVSWTLGYGMGTTVGLSQYWLLNVEGILQHVNEQEGWTRDLNLLTRFRLTADRQLGRRLSFFLGPHLSILASDRIDPESGEYQSMLTPYTFHQNTRNGRTVSMWIGFGGGLRF